MLTGFRNKKRTNPFVQIDKKMLSDLNISWKAKGILAYLLSKPDNWVTYASDIEKQATDGRDSVASGIKELLAAGYMERKQIREKGKFKGYEYSVYEYPVGPKSTDNGKTDNGESDNEKTDIGKPVTSNNNLSNNDLSNTNNNNNACETAFSFYEKNGFGILIPHVGEKIGLWINDTSEELVIHALKTATENGVLRWNYAETILRDWQNKKYVTVQQVIAAEEQRMAKKDRGVGGHKNGEVSRRDEPTEEYEDGINF